MSPPRKVPLGIVMQTLQDYIREHDMPPTIEELRGRLGVGSTRTALRYLRELEDKGWITRWPGARGIRLERWMA